MRTKVFHVFSDVDQSHLIKTFGEVMDKTRYDVGFVFFGKKKPLLYEYFGDRGYTVKFFEFQGKKDYPAALLKLRSIFKRHKPDIVHTHLVEGSLAGLTAAALAGVKRRIHTRHHGIESHIYSPHGVYYDRVNNFLSKKIIAISAVVANVLIEREGVNPKKVVTIPHGFHLEEFIVDKTVTDELRVKYGLDGHFPVIGSVARFIHWKGVHNTVAAFKKVLEKYPNAKLVLANASGPYSSEIIALLGESVPPDNYVVIEFERNIFSLYPAFDVFVHVPVDPNLEAFGLVYIEPLALEIPSVFTLSGIASEFIRNKENAVVVPYNDPAAIANAVELILEDKDLRERMKTRGKADVWERFHTDRLASQLDALYTGL